MTNAKTKTIDGVEYQLNHGAYIMKFNKYHLFDGKPTIIYSDGTKEWRVKGSLHRDNDKPAIIWSDGTKEWWVDGIPQPEKYFVCFYIRSDKQYKKFFATELQAKQYESNMLAKNLCAWVEENV